MKTPSTTPFGFSSTATDVIRDVDLSGQNAVVTGGGSGIGIETSRALAKAGASVTLAVRRPDEALDIARDLRQSTGNSLIDVRYLDLSDLSSVKVFANDWRGPLHILVNNAGIMATPRLETTPQGFELQFGTNYLGHFALAHGLRRALASAKGARIVSVSSSGHQFSPVIFDDLNFDFIPYTPIGAYGQSKTANALLAVGVTQRWINDGITANAANPGAIPTRLQINTGGLKTPIELRKTPEQGAATSVLLAASPLLENVSGFYFEDNNVAARIERRATDFSGGVADYALDPANAERLWDLSVRLIS